MTRTIAEHISSPVIQSADTLAFAHGSVAVAGARDEVRYTIAAPEVLTADSVGLIVPGFGAIKPTSRRLRNALAQQEGMAVVSYDPLRVHAEASNNGFDLRDPQELHYRTISAILEDMSTSRSIRRLPNGPEIADQFVTFFPHSMGGLPTAEFAAENPCITKGVAYLGCIGMEDPLGIKIVGRAAKEVACDVFPNAIKGRYGRDVRLLGRSLYYFASNITRTTAEIFSCATADNRNNVYTLARAGVSQTVLCFEDDAFFRPADTYEHVAHVVDAIETMPNADHTAPQCEPNRTAQHIGQLLRQADDYRSPDVRLISGL